MRRGRVAAILAVLAALVLWGSPARAATVTLEQARAVPSAAARPGEVDFSQGTQVALPDNWLRNRPGLQGTIWYELPLDGALEAVGAPAGEPLALVVPRLADSGSLWLNGERLHTGAADEFTRNRALWVPLPLPLLRPQGNSLQVRVNGLAVTRGGLAAPTLGTPASLRPGYELRRFFQGTIPQTLIFSVVICMFGGAALWLKTRRRIDFLFVALCLTWVPRALVILSPTAGSPTQGGMLAALGSTQLSNVLIMALIIEHSRWTGPAWRVYMRVLWGVIALCFATGALLAWRGEMRPALLGVLHWPFFALALLPLGAQIRQAWRTHRRSDVAMALTLVVWAVTVVHDLAVAADTAAFDSFFWAPVAALLVLLNLVWRSLASLALHRASAQHEISRAVAQERLVVLAEERSRLLHDLHDGLGGQLITALRMTRRDEVPREDVARVIEDSLEDMRLIIDSLDLEERDLLPLLGSVRYRLEPRLNAIGVALHWDAEVLPELDYLSPETGLAIVRIVQEAVNNAVRHGNARNVTVRARAGLDAIELSVRDDGSGFDVLQPAPKGAPQRGLGAMRMRADRLGGTLAISSGPAGTCVTLVLPLRR